MKKNDGYVNNHIVPKSYLQKFATEGTKRGRYLIGVCNNKLEYNNGRLVVSSISKVARIANFYDVVDEDTKRIEKWLDRNIDTLCGGPLSSIVKRYNAYNDGEVITDSDKDILSKIIVAQYVRSPFFIDKSVSFAKELVDKFTDLFLTLDFDGKINIVDILKDANFDNYKIKSIILKHFFIDQEYLKVCEFLKENIWVVYYNKDYREFPYVTCDNPVVILKNVNFIPADNIDGINGNALMFPLSPSLVLCIYPKSMSVIFKEGVENRKISISDNKFVSNINFSLSDRCYKQIFLPTSLLNKCKYNDLAVLLK